MGYFDASLFEISLFVFVMSSHSFLFFLVWRQRRESVAIQYFLLTLSLLMAWTVINFLYRVSVREDWIALFVETTLIFSSPMAVAFLWFSMHFTVFERTRLSLFLDKYKWWHLGLSLLFGLVGYSPYLERIVEINGEVLQSGSRIDRLFPYMFVTTMAVAFYILVHKYRRSSGHQKKALWYVIFGGIIGVSVGSYTNVFLTFFLDDFKLAYVGSLAGLFFTIFTTYAVIRHQFLDIQFVLRRSAWYIILAALIYAFFYAVGYFYDHAFGGSTDPRAMLAGIVIVFIFLFLLRLAEHKVKNFLNRYLFSSLTDFETAVSTLNQRLSGLNDERQIVEATLQTIDRFVRSSSSTFVPGEAKEKEGFGSTQAGLSLPVKFENQILGYLVLGNKPSGYDYSDTELRLLKNVVQSLGIALNNARSLSQLREQKEKLESLLQQKNLFLRLANHQLRTPFSVLSQSFDLSRKTNLSSADQHKFLQQTESGIESLQRVINDVLAANEITGEKLTLRRERVSVNKLIQRVADEFRGDAQAKGLNFHVELLDEDVSVFWDKAKMEQVFRNLVENAVDYTVKGEVRVVCKCENEKLHISVSDTGIGMSKKFIDEQLFGLFERDERAKKLRPDGSGLGLFIAKKYVEAHGGEIIVTEGGSQFVVQILVKTT